MNDLNVKDIRKELGLTQKELAKKLGVSEATVQNWEYGRTIPATKHQMLCAMLNPQPQTVNGHYISGSHNNVAGQNLIIGDSAGQAQNNSDNSATTSALAKVPIVPQLIKDLPNIDILEYLKNKRDNITYSPIFVDGVQLAMWFTVDDNALLPLFRRGDMVGLIEEPHDAITGKVYVIDTYPYGMLFRRVVADATSDTLLLRSLNKDDYPDIIIKKSDVIRLYKIMCMVRLNNDI